MVQLKDALNVVWDVEESEESGLWHFARNYVLSFAAVLALGFLLLVSLLVSAGLAAAGKYAATYLPEGALHVISILTSFVVVMALFAMMFKWLPDVSVGWRDVWLGGEGGHRLLHRQAGAGIDLRSGGLDRRRADLGLLHVTDHLDGRGGHPQLREAQRLFQAPRPRRSAGKPATAVAVPTCAEPRATVVVEDRLIDEHRSPRPSTTGKGPRDLPKLVTER